MEWETTLAINQGHETLGVDACTADREGMIVSVQASSEVRRLMTNVTDCNMNLDDGRQNINCCPKSVDPSDDVRNCLMDDDNDDRHRLILRCSASGLLEKGIRKEAAVPKDCELGFISTVVDEHTSLGMSDTSLNSFNLIEVGDLSVLNPYSLLVMNTERDLTCEKHALSSQIFDTDASNQTESSTHGSILHQFGNTDKVFAVSAIEGSIIGTSGDQRVQVANLACLDSNFNIALITDVLRQPVNTNMSKADMFNNSLLDNYKKRNASSDSSQIPDDTSTDIPASKISKMLDSEGQIIARISQKMQQQLTSTPRPLKGDCLSINSLLKTSKPSTTTSVSESIGTRIALISNFAPSKIISTGLQTMARATVNKQQITHETMEVDRGEMISTEKLTPPNIISEQAKRDIIITSVYHHDDANMADDPVSLSKSTSNFVPLAGFGSSDFQRNNPLLPITNNNKHSSSNISMDVSGKMKTFNKSTSILTKPVSDGAVNKNHIFKAPSTTNSNYFSNTNIINHTVNSNSHTANSINMTVNFTHPIANSIKQSDKSTEQTANSTHKTVSFSQGTANCVHVTSNSTRQTSNSTSKTTNSTNKTSNAIIHTTNSAHIISNPTHFTSNSTHTISNCTNKTTNPTHRTFNPAHLISTNQTSNTSILASNPTNQITNSAHLISNSPQPQINFSVPISKSVPAKIPLRFSNSPKRPLSNSEFPKHQSPNSNTISANPLPLSSNSGGQDHNTMNTVNHLNDTLSISSNRHAGTTNNAFTSVPFKTNGTNTDIRSSAFKNGDLHFQKSAEFRKSPRDVRISEVFQFNNESKPEITFNQLGNCQIGVLEDVKKMKPCTSSFAADFGYSATATLAKLSAVNNLNYGASTGKTETSFQKTANVQILQKQTISLSPPPDIGNIKEVSLSLEISAVSSDTELSPPPSTSSICLVVSSPAVFSTTATTPSSTPSSATSAATDSGGGEMGRRLRNRNQRKFLPEKTRHKRQTLQDMTRPLKQWLYKHRANPYPNKQEKIELVGTSHMSLTQVSNWFANARRRLKNTVSGDGLSWAKRVTEYNHHAEGNAELFSIPSSDEDAWDSEDEVHEHLEPDIHTESIVCQSNSPSPAHTLTSSFSESSVCPQGTAQSSLTPQSGTTRCSPALDDQHGNYQKYKHSILQRYLQDASQQTLLPAEDLLACRARHRHLSSSTGSHDFEYLSTSSVSSPSHDTPHDSFDEFSEEFESIAIRRRITETPAAHQNDDIYWKEIGAALALTSLARSHISK